jgi:Cap4 dsDNA endonuclease
MRAPEKAPESAKAQPRLPSFRDLTPTEEGGVNAREGFHYQDHVAAELCCQMLQDVNLLEVCCETLDDVMLVWSIDGGEEFELVQVKNEQKDSLWSVARLCNGTGGVFEW